MITNTKCDKCIFKISENSKQTGCKLEIDKIISQNYPGLYDSNNIDKSQDSWILKNFKCTYARTHQWLEMLKDLTDEDPLDKVITDSVIPYYVVIILNNNSDDLEDILEDLSNNQNYWPTFISFILTDRSSYKPKECIKLLEQYNLPKWKVHYITDSEFTISEMIDMCLDTNLSDTQSSFIFIKYADTVYKKNTMKRTNEIINHCIGKKVILFTDNFLDGFVIDKSLYINMNKQIGLVYDYVINDEETHKIKIL